MAEHNALVLKQRYTVGKKLKEDLIGIIYEGFLLPNNLTISIREYHNQFCHPTLVEKIQVGLFAIAELNQPNIVRVLDSIYTDDGRFFIIYDTPYEGCLSDILAKLEKFPEHQVFSIITDLGKALEHIHQKKVTHGAINPDNIDILGDGRIKLRNTYIDDLLNSFVLTKGRSVLTPGYLAPEQLRGEVTTRTTDIFALGILAYQLLSGRKPYPDIASLPMMLKNFHKEPEKLTLRDPYLPKYLEDILDKAVQAKPNYRHQSITEFLGDMRAKKVTLRVEELKRRENTQPQTPPVNEQTYGNITPPPQREELDIPDWPRRQQTTKRPPQRPVAQRYEAKESTMAEPVVPTPKQTLQQPEIRKIAHYIIIGLFTGIILLIINSVFSGYFESVPKTEIPAVTGKTLSEATHMLSSAGFRYKIAGYVNNETVTPNCIVDTIPEVGRIVKKQRIIKLFVSKGGDDLFVPDLVDRSLNTVEQITKEKGLVLDSTEHVYSNKYQRGQVISQSPEPSQPIKKGQSIKVVVSNGYPVGLTLVDKNDRNTIIKVTVSNEPTWEVQNVFIYIQDNNGRRKHFEKLLNPGEHQEVEVVAENNAVVEVYYFNDLALKQDLQELKKP